MIKIGGAANEEEGEELITTNPPTEREMTPTSPYDQFRPTNRNLITKPLLKGARATAGLPNGINGN